MIDFFQSRKSVDLGAVPCYSSPGENKYVSKQRNTSDLNFKTPTLKSSVNESHKKNLDGLNTATKAGKARNAQTSSHFKNGYSETSQKFSRAIFKNSGSQISSISNFEDLLHHSINEEQSPQQNSKYFENEKESVYDPLSYDYSDESFTFYNHPELYDFSRLKIEPIKETPKKSKPKIESIDITKPHHVTEWSTGGSSRLCSTDSSINLSPFTSSKAKPKTGHRRIVSDIHASIAEDLANDILNKSSNDLNNSMNSGFLTKILENDLENFELIAKEKIFNEMKKISTSDLASKGIFLCPSSKNILNWYVTLKISAGLYKGKIFKALVDIPINYPKYCPRVYFTTAIHHPLIDKETCEVDMSLISVEKDYFCEIPRYLKDIFDDPKYLKVNDSNNPTAAHEYWTDVNLFKEKILKLESDNFMSLNDNTNHNPNVTACVQKGLYTTLTLSSKMEREKVPKILTQKFIDRVVDNISALL